MNMLPQHIVDEAIAWTVKLQYNTPTETTLARFTEWLQRHPSHREAWQRVSAFKIEHSKVPAKLARATLNSFTSNYSSNALRKHSNAGAC